jgi:hypothetical protein
VGWLIPSPAVVIFNDIVFRGASHATAFLEIVGFSVNIDGVEVVVLLFIEIGKIPEDANILKRKIVPFVIVWVIWIFVAMNVCSSSKASFDFD